MSDLSLWRCDQWLKLFASQSSQVEHLLGGIFGEDRALIAQRSRFYRHVLEAARPILGDRTCFVMRCPARVNLMGMHVEHQGGLENPICIPREHFAVVAPRDDDEMRLYNVDLSFQQSSVQLGRLVSPALLEKDWPTYCRQDAPVSEGLWTNYVIGAAAQMIRFVKGQPLRGFCMVLGSDIPLARGLSSSAALVLVVLKALELTNHLTIADSEMIRMAGAAELVVGTIGGDGDGSAMINARAGQCVHHGFFPYEASTYRLPSELGIVLANSGTRAEKQAGARDTFNERITCYRLGRMLLNRALQAEHKSLEHLGQLAYGELGLKPARVYPLLKTVPPCMTREEACQRLALTDRDELEFIFSTHEPPQCGYHVRRRVLFGLAEMQRAHRFRTAAFDGDVHEMGTLKTIGHNGDRVTWPVANYKTPDDDAYLDLLAINDFPLAYVTGGYECSTPQLDALVDAARDLHDVYGAGLTGAGLGGSVVILCRRDAIDTVIAHLGNKYYLPRGLPVDHIQEVFPIAGLSTMTSLELTALKQTTTRV